MIFKAFPHVFLVFIVLICQVALVNPGSMIPWCGGSLLSNQYVITAAHCTDGHTASSIEILLGEHDTSDSIVDRHTIHTITEHENYNRASADYDFAILKLSAPITFSSVAAPICLPSSELSLYVDQIATAIGWGHTSSEGTSSSILQEVDVTVISNQQCANSYGSQIKK